MSCKVFQEVEELKPYHSISEPPIYVETPSLSKYALLYDEEKTAFLAFNY